MACAGGNVPANSRSSGCRFPTGGSRRGDTILRNHLFAPVAHKYVHPRQTVVGRKGLEETERLPAKRASKQSPIGHGTKTSLTSWFRCIAAQYLLYHIFIAATKIAFRTCRLLHRCSPAAGGAARDPDGFYVDQFRRRG